jgi:signal peptidase I
MELKHSSVQNDTTLQHVHTGLVSSPHDDASQEPPRRFQMLGEIIHFSILALVIVLPIRMFVAQPFIVSGASMETTFYSGQYLIVDQLSYHFEEPEHGEVIVFRYPKDPSKFFIKRIIGIPGDVVRIEGNKVTITNETYPDGILLDEEYVFAMNPNTTLEETLGEDEYFVMGDNRNASSDSRMWGVLHRENIVGRAFLRLFPFTEVDVFPGKYDTDAFMNNAANT